MSLEHLLSQKKAAVLGRWRELILDTYPADSSAFFKKEKDRFVNPVGFTIATEIESLYDGLLQGISCDEMSASLDSIIRIRAVQDFSPSEAIGFPFLLKKAIRDELWSAIKDNQLFEELLDFESRLNELAMLAIDIYVECREKIYEIRVNEAKAEKAVAMRLLEITNLGRQEAESS